MTEQEYLLTCLMEECAEVTHRASKALRFGLQEVGPGSKKSNFTRLEDELSDVIEIARMLKLQAHEWTPNKMRRWNKALTRSSAQGILQ